MDNLKFSLVWVDELDATDRLIEIEVEASSARSSASQECYISAHALQEVGELMVRHSFDPTSKRTLMSGEQPELPETLRASGVEYTAMLSLSLHKADFSGKLPIEIVFELEDPVIGRYSATVIVWTELGQLERFGKSVSALPSRGMGSFCELNPRR